MEEKPIDLCVFDLDGTLVHEDGFGGREVPKILQDALVELAKRCPFIVATGRRYRSVEKFFSQIPSLPQWVLNNGLVVRKRSGELLKRSSLSLATALDILKLLDQYGKQGFLVYDGDHPPIDFIFSKISLQKCAFLQELSRLQKDHCHVLDDEDGWNQLNPQCILEVSVLGEYNDLLKLKKRISAQLPQDLRPVLVGNIGRPGWSVLEIFEKKSSKWSGVEFVQKNLGATRILTVGDDENDIEMLDSAYMGVVMKHARPHVRQYADFEVDGVKGLAQFLRKFEF